MEAERAERKSGTLVHVREESSLAEVVPLGVGGGDTWMHSELVGGLDVASEGKGASCVWSVSPWVTGSSIFCSGKPGGSADVLGSGRKRSPESCLRSVGCLGTCK